MHFIVTVKSTSTVYFLGAVSYEETKNNTRGNTYNANTFRAYTVLHCFCFLSHPFEAIVSAAEMSAPKRKCCDGERVRKTSDTKKRSSTREHMRAVPYNRAPRLQIQINKRLL